MDENQPSPPADSAPAPEAAAVAPAESPAEAVPATPAGGDAPTPPDKPGKAKKEGLLGQKNTNPRSVQSAWGLRYI